MAYRIGREVPVRHELRRIAHEQIDHGLAELGDEALALDEKVHQVRKRCKKLRGLMRLVRSSLGETYSRENAQFRDAARALAPIRDSGTVIDAYDRVLDAYGDEVDRPALAPLRRRLTERRTRLLQQEIDVDACLEDAARRLREAGTRVDSWQLSEKGFEACAGGAKKTYKRGVRGLEAVMDATQPDPEMSHEWRKRVKYHWYHLRLLRECWPEIMKPLAHATHQLADYLGDEHDLAVLCEVLRNGIGERASAERLDVVTGLIGQRRRRLLELALPLGWRIFARKPSSVVRELGGYWQAWKGVR